MGAGMDERHLGTYAAGEVEVPYVISAFAEQIERDTRWPEHAHPTHELLWNERGTSTATVGRRTWTITSRHGLWIPAGVPHIGQARAGTWMRAAQFGVTRVPALASMPVAVDMSPLLHLLLQRLDEPDLSQASREVAEAMVLDVMQPAPRELLVHVPENEALRPVVEATLADPGDARSLADWAELLSLSTRTITRLFQSETGLGFGAWTAAVRAQLALTMLSAGDEIEDVAEATGYRSVSAFGAAFRRTTGLTPGAIRLSESRY